MLLEILVIIEKLVFCKVKQISFDFKQPLYDTVVKKEFYEINFLL